MTISYFEHGSDNTFIGQDPARGPWDAHACHAGPVTGLVARALEQLFPGKMLTRLTLNLLRPTPLAGFRVETEIEKEGRSVSTATAQVISNDGKVCVQASSLFLPKLSLEDVPTASFNAPDFNKATPVGSPLQGSVHGKDSFGNFIEAAMETGEPNATGPKLVWTKTPSLLADEPTSPIQSICPIADCGNGLARNGTLGHYSFINADLSIHFHREPMSQWLATDVISHWQNTGIGMSQSVICDTKGPVATSLQTLIIRPSNAS